MEQKARQFREEAARHNRGRKGVRRRYPEDLRDLAVSYCSTRQQGGASLNQIARELGINGWSLNRWVRETKKRAGFVKVEVQPATESMQRVAECCVLLTPEGYRVEGLTAEGVGRLLRVLR
jgi:transposase